MTLFDLDKTVNFGEYIIVSQEHQNYCSLNAPSTTYYDPDYGGS